MFHVHLLGVVCAIWVASEVLVGVLKGDRRTLSKEDRGTLPVLWVTSFGSALAGVFVRNVAATRMPLAAFWVGLALIVAGIALRWIAIVTLGRYFNVAITIRQGHEIVDRGLYGVVRHPSYSGAILSFVGLGVALQNWLSVAILAVAPLAAFAYRINVEERVLTAHFGDAYREYATRTKRLIPWIY